MRTDDLPLTWASAAKREYLFKHYRTTWGAITSALTDEHKVRRLELTGEQYRNASDQVRADCKNGPCWWGAELVNGEPQRRKSIFAKSRTMLALDIDKTMMGSAEFCDAMETLFYEHEFILHPSASSTPDNVSARLVFPLARAVQLEVYEALARQVAVKLQGCFGDAMDWTSVQPNRLMYFPTLPSDSVHWSFHNSGVERESSIEAWDFTGTPANMALFDTPVVDWRAPWLDPLDVLRLVDRWTDRTTWPVGKTEDAEAIQSRQTTRTDPRTFNGVHGAVCRTYSVNDVLPRTGKWAESVESDRWSYIGATTANGGQVFDDGLFFYSHHNSDPHGGRLLDAFEILLAHKFDGLTGEAENDAQALEKAIDFGTEDDQVVQEVAEHQAKFESAMIQGFQRRDTPVQALDRVLEKSTPPENATEVFENSEKVAAEEERLLGNKIPKFEYPSTLMEMLDRYVFLEHAGSGLKVFDRQRACAVVLPAGIHDQHYRMHVGERGGVTKIKALDEWKSDNHRMTAQTLTWNPQRPMLFRDDDGYLCCNEYRREVHAKGDVSLPEVQQIIDHVNWLLPLKRDRAWFWQWMAHLVQRPGVRMGIVPLMIARSQGAGRGALSMLLRGILGSRNVNTPRIDDLLNSQFNGYLFNCTLTVVDEVYTDDKAKYSLQEKINAMITEQNLRYEEKKVQAEDRECFTNILMFSNKPDALKLSYDDRRVQVLTNPDLPAKWEISEAASAAYYNSLYTAIRGHTHEETPTEQSEITRKRTLAGIYAHLMSIDLKGFVYGRAWTDQEAKEDMADSGRSATELTLKDLCESPPSIAMSYMQIKEWCASTMSEDGTGRSAHDPVNNAELQRLCRDGRYVKLVNKKRHRYGQSSAKRLYYFVKHGKVSEDLAKAAARKYENNEIEGEGFVTRDNPGENVTSIK